MDSDSDNEYWQDVEVTNAKQFEKTVKKTQIEYQRKIFNQKEVRIGNDIFKEIQDISEKHGEMEKLNVFKNSVSGRFLNSKVQQIEDRANKFKMKFEEL